MNADEREQSKNVILFLLSPRIPQHRASIEEVLARHSLPVDSGFVDQLIHELHSEASIIERDGCYLITHEGMARRLTT